jgi:hypothetical protein
MSLYQKESFQHNTKLRHFQDNETDIDEVKTAVKVEYIIEKLAGILKVPEEKELQAKQLYNKVDVESAERFRDFDEVVFAGALIYYSCNKRPVRPRWKSLIADACMELCRDEDRIAYSYNQSYWKRRIPETVSYLKDSQEFNTDGVNGVDYMLTLFRFYSPSEQVVRFCLKTMPMIEQVPEFQSKKRVALAAAVLNIACEKFESNPGNQYGFEELGEDLCTEPSTIEKYRDLLLQNFFDTE